MVFIWDGCSFHVAHGWWKQGLFPKKKFGFDDSLYVTKCLQQIEMSDLLHVCTKSNEQPSNVKTKDSLRDFVLLKKHDLKYK